MRDKTFLIMAGGTGGHVFPALATAKKLIELNDKVVWLGSCGGMEEGIVNAAGIPFYGVSVTGVRGTGLKRKILAPFKVLHAIYQAWGVMRKVQPDAVLGMGGFASGPGGVAAKLMSKPLIIHEQNAAAGMTNRLLAKVADRVLSAFPSAFADKRINDKSILTGNPLREEITELYYRPVAKGQGDTAAPVKILVLGGSLGAAALNSVVPEGIGRMNLNSKPLVWHQTGKGKLSDVEAVYQDAGIDARVSEFIDDMSEAYRWADFVICRAGALTVSELCVAGLGALLVPYPHAVDDHQTLNAEYMVKAGAAWLIAQQNLSPESLSEMLTPLCAKPERISLLSKAALQLAKADATERVVNECRSLCYV